MATSTIDPSYRANEFSGTEGIYLLPHHAKEIERLQNQHKLILSSTENIVVVAPLKRSEPVRVLDCGAADGTWLRDLPRLMPEHSWELHGVDIGSDLFPKGYENPPLDLVELDIRQGPSPSLKWENSFDLVHQRLLIWGLQTSAWPQVIEKHKTLLKDGGWLQLVEGKWVDRETAFDPAVTPALSKMSLMQRWSTNTFGMNIFVAYELEDMLKAAGFNRIQKTDFALGYGAKARDPAWREPSAEMWIDTFRSLAFKLPEGGIPGVAKNAEEFMQFLEDLKREVLVHGYEPILSFVIGQK